MAYDLRMEVKNAGVEKKIVEKYVVAKTANNAPVKIVVSFSMDSEE